MKLGIKGRLRALVNGYADIRHLRVYHQNEFHKLSETRALAKFFRHFDVDCVFDIGANRGQYAQVVRNDVKFRGPIISVEPVPAIFADLNKAAAGDPNWHCENLGISHQAGSQQFHVMKGDQFSSFLNPSDAEYSALSQNNIAQTIDVRTERLDDIYRKWQAKLGFKNAYVKIDTQGYDHVVLSSGETVLPECAGVQSELAFKRLYEDSYNYAEMVIRLEELGFSLSMIFPNNAGHFPDIIEQDAIFYNSRRAAAR